MIRYFSIKNIMFISIQNQNYMHPVIYHLKNITIYILMKLEDQDSVFKIIGLHCKLVGIAKIGVRGII